MKTPISALAIFLIFFSSCALRPIPSEHNLVEIKKEKISLNDLGNGKVLIYNGANILHTMDNTAPLNIEMDGKNLGQLRAKDFVIVKLENGKHVFKIRHLDVVNMRSEHEVILTDNDTVKVIRVKPTLFSNKLEVVNHLPKKWEKYKYMDSGN